MDMNGRNEKPTSIRLPPDLLEAIDSMCENDGCSRNDKITNLLENAIENELDPKPEPEPIIKEVIKEVKVPVEKIVEKRIEVPVIQYVNRYIEKPKPQISCECPNSHHCDGIKHGI